MPGHTLEHVTPNRQACFDSADINELVTMSGISPTPAKSPRPAPAVGAVVLVTLLMLLVWRSRPRPQETAGEVLAPWTTAEARAAKQRDTVQQTIDGNLNLPLTPDANRRWESFLGAVKWQADRRPAVLAAVRRRLQLPPLEPSEKGLPREVQRLAIETAYGLFPVEVELEMRTIILTDHDPKHIGMAGAWLLRFDGTPAHRQSLADTVMQRFPDWKSEPRLLALATELHQPRTKAVAERPPLEALLRAPFDGRPVVFSFQRVDRRFRGRAVIRHANGGFLLGPDGGRFSVSQFALSVSGLPGTLTNGNTPCGIFGIPALDTTRNTAIGPSELLVLHLPLEDKSARPPWSEDRYLGLLPDSWKTWWPIREAWWAGQAGRFDILAHGTAIDPAPWLDSIFAGQTPSHGCLTCHETWDPESGRRLSSEQDKLVSGFYRAGGAPGYLVLVDLDNEARPVSEADVKRLLQNEQ